MTVTTKFSVNDTLYCLIETKLHFLKTHRIDIQINEKEETIYYYYFKGIDGYSHVVDEKNIFKTEAEFLNQLKAY